MAGLEGVIVLLAGMAMGAAGPFVTAYDKDGAILVNGQRTLIIGSYAAAKSDRPYAELAEAGFNLVSAGNAEALDQAAAAGLMTWFTVGTINPDEREKSGAALVEAVNKVKGHPSLAFLETMDEPAWTWMKAEQRIPAPVFAEAYPLIKQADPSHLLYMNQAPTNLVKTMRAYNAGTDIVACDIYPVNPGGLRSMYALFPDGHQGDLNNEHISQVGEYVDKMRQVTGPERPLFMVLQGFAWEDLTQDEGVEEKRQEKIQYPMWAQSRFMAFQSLIKGANGIIYWGHHTMPQPSQAWTDLKRVVREVADLAPVLAEPAAAVALTVDYEEMGHSVDDGVQWTARERDGKLYLFTCNADKNRCKAIITGLPGWTQCRVLNEDRTLPLTDGSLTDTWRRFDVHLYELSR